MKPIVTVTNMFPEAALEKLGSHCDLRTNQTENPPPAEDLKKYASESAVIVTYLTDKIDRDIINCGENLKLIANFGAGFNNIDVAQAIKKGIWVTNTPGVLHETTADLTWAMILGAARRIVPSDRFTRENRFKGWQAKMFLGGDVYGKTLGIIGCGEIGQAVARRASGFNMRVLYCNRNRLPAEKALNATYAPLEELLRQSDFVTVHVPLSEQTQHMIGKKQFLMMKPTAYIIHTARGKVVDDQALVEALKKGEIAGAALDVFEQEPLPSGHPLWSAPGVIITPHVAATGPYIMDRRFEVLVDNCVRFNEGRPLINMVDKTNWF